MALRKIRIYGDSILRRQAEPIADITPDIRTLAEDMIETMRTNEGIGLSGNQVGELLQIMTVDMTMFDETLEPLTLLNVQLRDGADTQVGEEGCLSVPGIREDVERIDRVTADFLALDGIERTMTCEGLLSRVIQHELDHLHGVLFVDHLSPITRNLIASKLKKLARGEPVA